MISARLHHIHGDVILIDKDTGRTVPDFMVHVRHLRAAGMCNREPRLWFARHGLSWTEFVTTGIPASRILTTNDSLAPPVVEIAWREVNGE